MEYEFRSLGHWTDRETPPHSRKPSRFRSDYEATLDLLFAEAEALGAKHLVLQIDVQQRDIRLDGLPRATARYGSHPGVVVSFDSRYGPLRYATDAFDGWRANLRAIALALGALRAVDRYGVTKRGEQYRGWSALPAARGGSSMPFLTREDAEQWMRTCARESGIGTWATWKALYRVLAQKMHPDVQDGSTDLWERLDAAADLLGIRGNGA